MFTGEARCFCSVQVHQLCRFLTLFSHSPDIVDAAEEAIRGVSQHSHVHRVLLGWPRACAGAGTLFLCLFGSNAAPSHSDGAALRLCSSVSLRQALAAFASEQSLLFCSAETPEREYKRGRIAGSASLKKKR